VKVRYTITALGEIDEICSYIARDNPKAAADIAREIANAVGWICKHPGGAPVALGNIRAKLIGRYQYRIFYTFEKDDLVIRNVRSTKRLRPWEPA
jgi:plasmid stabilization system protein ParE